MGEIGSKYRYSFKIQSLPPTINAIGRKHWGYKATVAKNWRTWVAYAISVNKPPQPLTKAKITFIRNSSKRPDHDGLVSSFKHVQDGLIDARVIVNDTYDVIGEPTYQWKPSRRGFIQVEIEEL